MNETANRTEFDVIVIGAGMAGLACAAKLQKAGKNVLLVEQHKKVGGYCTNFKRKGYEFEAAIHFIAGCEPGGILHNILVECGAEKYVNFIKLDPVVYKAVFPDRTLLIPPTIAEFKELIAREFPEEKENAEKYFDGLERIYDLVNLLNSKNVSGLRKVLVPLLNSKALFDFVRYLNANYGSYLETHIRDHRVREVVSQLWGFLGVPPSRLSFIFFVMGFMAYYKEGAYYIEGGSEKLAEAIGRAFEENGGVLLTRTDARKIIIRNNTAVGVEVEDKKSDEKTVYHGEIIVSCADATHTFLDMVGESRLPTPFVNRLKQLKPAISAFGVYLGVDMDLPEEFKNDFDIFINNNYDSESAFESMLGREAFEALAISIYSNIYPSFSPEPGKKHVIILLTVMDLDEANMLERWGTADIYDRGEEYKKIKDEIARRMIAKAEEYIPGLSEHIEVMETASPITMKRYTRNLNGSILGWENSVAQSLLNRMKQSTPVRNLFMGSAWTFPGGGVNGASMGGAMVADRVLKQLGRRFRLTERLNDKLVEMVARLAKRAGLPTRSDMEDIDRTVDRLRQTVSELDKEKRDPA